MPQDLLAFPAYYTVGKSVKYYISPLGTRSPLPFSVGVYRLATDPIIRKAVWDKVKHATLRGIVASAVWTTVTYPWQRWFVRLFLVGKRSTPGVKGVDFALGWLREMDAVECESPPPLTQKVIERNVLQTPRSSSSSLRSPTSSTTFSVETSSSHDRVPTTSRSNLVTSPIRFGPRDTSKNGNSLHDP